MKWRGQNMYVAEEKSGQDFLGRRINSTLESTFHQADVQPAWLKCSGL